MPSQGYPIHIDIKGCVSKQYEDRYKVQTFMTRLLDFYTKFTYVQSNLTLVAVKIRDNLTLRDKMKMTVFLCSKSPSK